MLYVNTKKAKTPFFVSIVWYIYNMRRVFFIIFILSLITIPLGAQEEGQRAPQTDPQSFSQRFSWFLEGSVLFFPEDNGMYSDPMPVLPSLGAGVSYSFTRFIRMELTWDLYMTHYGYSHELDRAVPNAIENRTARVIGSLLGIQAVGYFDVTPFMTIRAYAGPAADLRIVFIAEDLNEGLDDLDAIHDDVDAVRKYFWSSGRWFMPVIGTGVDFTINDKFRLGIDMRVWAPMYRLWSGEDLPAIEGWRFGPGIRFTFR